MHHCQDQSIKGNSAPFPRMLAASDGNEDVLPAVVEQELWSASLAAFDSGDYESAAIMGRKIGNKARAIYNVGICYLLLGDEDSAVQPPVAMEPTDLCLAGW